MHTPYLEEGLSGVGTGGRYSLRRWSRRKVMSDEGHMTIRLRLPVTRECVRARAPYKDDELPSKKFCMDCRRVVL